MKHKFLIGAVASLAGVAAFAAKDPVVMTVNGVDVPRSEFEYLYHKNTRQQVEAQPLDEYAEMFKVYKLKVADALAAGIDTTAKFRREMRQYQRELAAPYIADSTFLYKFAHQQYDDMGTEIEARHIMLFKKNTRDINQASKARLDSIYNVIKSGAASFEEMAQKYSEDQQSAKSGGLMGYMTAGSLPYSFEKVMYATPEGQISEVFETPVGFHIIKGGHRRPASGEVHTAHILFRADPRLPQEIQNRAKQLADSIYQVVKADPSQFAEIAKKYSQDPGSAKQGGELPWFGVGRMVPEFSDAAFALADGEISEPVKTGYGYHIIQRLGHRGRPAFDEVKDGILKKITNTQDERNKLVRDNNIKRLGKQFKMKENAPLLKELREYVAANGLDSTFFARYNTPEMKSKPVFTIGKKPYTLETLMVMLQRSSATPEVDLLSVLNDYIAAYENVSLYDTQLEWLPTEYPDYRNLLNEYRDGSLLYEISLQNVWDKAAQDTEGLKKYFDAHKGDFKWTEPRYKGFLVKANSDSVADAVRARLPQLGRDSLVNTIRSEFGKTVQIDRILVKKGDNQYVDYLVQKPAEGDAPVSANYPVYFIYDLQVLDAPQEVDDVKGLVTGAYQDQLERDWVEALKSRYPVTVNEKELKKIK